MSTAGVAVVAPGIRGLRAREYDALVEAGFLDDEPVELLEGALVRVSPQRPAHAEAVRRVVRALTGQLGVGWVVSVQSPFVAGDLSEPEPDVAVVLDDEYSDRHPSRAALVVEVAGSSRGIDLGVKARVYGASGVAEYWVLDLADSRVHVHRGPGADGWAEVAVVEEGTLTTRAEPRLTIEVGAVLHGR